jgi:thioredoxin 1
MKTLTEANFETELTGQSLVLFWATWCGPCMNVKSLEEFQIEMPNVMIGKVNVEENQDLAQKHSIIMVPTYIFFEGTKPVSQLYGVQTKEDFMESYEECFVKR